MGEKYQPGSDAKATAKDDAPAKRKAGQTQADAKAKRKDDAKAKAGAKAKRPQVKDPFIRAANEDDDGYDPYSDRPARREPLFERDPWA